MKWEIAPKQRVDLVCYGGLNMSGERRVVDVHVVNGRQGPDIPTAELKSLSFIAPVGTRLILKTSESEDWEAHPWRCIRIVKGSFTRTSNGDPIVRVPDLDYLDKPDARRTDSECQESFPLVQRLSEGTGWTFGREGEIKGRVKVICIEKEPAP